MTSTTPQKTEPSKPALKLIHAALILGEDGRKRHLFLRQLEARRFVWFEELPGGEEKETDLATETIEEALRLSARRWKERSYRNINCGFRYNLPERDEHGINALFHQMAASYNSMNGVYYDDELGNNCFVQSASEEALALWKRKCK
jgi:hypothetical protein